MDGVLWGRGAIDMKGPLAMMISALLRARAEGRTFPTDVIFAALSDEEAGSSFGARFLVEGHPYLFSGVKYGIGEFGAATVYIAGTRLYPIMIAEKHAAWLKATVKARPATAPSISREALWPLWPSSSRVSTAEAAGSLTPTPG